MGVSAGASSPLSGLAATWPLASCRTNSSGSHRALQKVAIPQLKMTEERIWNGFHLSLQLSFVFLQFCLLELMLFVIGPLY